MASTLTASTRQDKTERAVEAKAHEFIKRLGIQPTEFKRYTGMADSTQEKYVQVRFSEAQQKKWDFLEILHITDVQFGHICLKNARVKEYNDWVLSEPNRFVVFGGDMIDAANAFSPGQPWENLFEAQSQIYKFCDTFAPVAHRVLGYVGGNHERRGQKTFGDLGILLAKLLQIPYSSGQQFIDIHWGAWKPFKIDLWHGKGAALTPGARMNMLYSAMMASDANLVLVGHLHDAFCKFRWLKVRDKDNLKVKFIKQGGAMSSSFLEYIGSYAEVMNMPASDCMMACARLEPSGHWQLNLR
jgi:hypothetical protein